MTETKVKRVTHPAVLRLKRVVGLAYTARARAIQHELALRDILKGADDTERAALQARYDEIVNDKNLNAPGR